MKTTKKTTTKKSTVEKVAKEKKVVVSSGVKEIEKAIDYTTGGKKKGFASDMGNRYRNIINNKKIRESLFDRSEAVLYSRSNG